MSEQPWFAVREVEPDVYLVCEPPHVNSYLVVGSERAMLLDTGMGISDIKAVVDGITDLPILVVNSHHHFDHIGGNHLFNERAIHAAGVDLVQQETPPDWCSGNMAYIAGMLERVSVYEELDRAYFRLLTADTSPRPLPAGFDAAEWRIVPCAPTKALHDGDVIDLGGWMLRVFHTPGHSIDSICLFDQTRGVLFGGDTIMTGPIYTHLPGGNVGDLARSVRQLMREVGSDVKTIYCSHMLRYSVDGAFLAEVADGAQRVLAGFTRATQGTDIFGEPVTECFFNRFSITIH